MVYIIGERKKMEDPVEVANALNKKWEAEQRRKSLEGRLRKTNTKKPFQFNDYPSDTHYKSSLDDLILYEGFGKKVGDHVINDALVLLDPKTGKYEVLNKGWGGEDSWIYTAVPFGGKILYAGAFGKDGTPYALVLFDPKTGKYEVLNEKGGSENNVILTAVPVGDRILYATDSKDGVKNALVLLDPKTGKYEVLNEKGGSENNVILTAVPVGDKILYAGRFGKKLSKDRFINNALVLLDPKTGKYEVLNKGKGWSGEDSWISTAVPVGDKILYAGAFSKNDTPNALVLLDPKTGKYEVLNEGWGGEDDWIYTAVPVGDKILYAGRFGKKLSKDRFINNALVLLDPKTGKYEVLNDVLNEKWGGEYGSIHTAVPVSRKVFGYLLEK